MPLIEIRDAEDRGALADAIAASSYDWIVFTSVNGVAAVSEGLMGLPDLALPPWVRSPPTRFASAASSRRSWRRAPRRTSRPGSASSQGSACSCRRRTSQSPRSRTNCATRADVDVVVAYRTVLVEPPMWGIPRSGSPMRRSRERLGVSQPRGCRRRRRGAMLVCIGPKTAKVAREVGLKVGLVADETTSDGIIRALVSHFGEST